MNNTTKEDINKLKSEIDMDKLPKHIAIIMDGNGRWAKKRSLPRNFGHKEGVERVIDIVEASHQLGIKYLTLYAFSIENWNRPKDEVFGLMKLLVFYIEKELEKLNKNNVKIQILGDIRPLPDLPRKEVEKAIEKTKDNTGLILNIALNYGGRDEIVHGVRELLKDIKMGKISVEDLDADNFSNYLYTKGQPDPDLLIRTSGEQRLSNFLLYQIAYAEFWFTDVLWPDFSEKYLYEAIVDFQNRNRRFGGI